MFRVTQQQAPASDVVRPSGSESVPSEQQARIEDLRSGHGAVLILGAPGTGKTTALLDAIACRLRDGLPPEALLVVAPSRAAAAGLRSGLAARTDRTFSEPAVRTWAAYAFDLIRRARLQGYLPHVERPPRLLSGPEQDTLIGQLLAGHETGLTHGPAWPESLGEAVATRGFRQEIRELFDRLSEHGLEAGDLQDLGRTCGKPEWTAAASLYQEYRDLLDLGSAEAFDPAGLITAAADLLYANPGLLADERKRLGLVAVDDLQEANPAQHRLLSALCSGSDLLAFAAPDNAVQGFRGARPDLLSRFDSLYGSAERPAVVIELTRSFRMAPAVARSWERIARRVPVAAGAAGRRLDGPEDVNGTARAGNVEVHLVESPIHELRLVAQRILEEHLMDGRPLQDMAVVVRNGGQVRTVARHLAHQGIAVSVPAADVALRDEPAVRPLLDLLRLALALEACSEENPDADGEAGPGDPGTPELPGAAEIETLLTSRYGQSNALDVRRLRQALRREERLSGGTRGSSELLTGMFQDLPLLGTLGREGRGARRLGGMLTAARAEVSRPEANAETALWALWDSSGMAAKWSEAALAGGSAGARADADLDAVLALFQAAERFVDQLPGSTVGQFVDHVLGQELPMDSLAGRGGTGPAVEVLTPAAAVGREWDLVVVPGLQEGIWPNTRLRGELLGSGALGDVVEHGTRALAERDAASRLRAVRADELRTFAAACSRARDSLVCIAVESEDHQPSGFLDLVLPWEDRERPRPLTQVPRPRTLAALVAMLRQRAEDGGRNPAEQADAAAVLARLATSERAVRGAAPESWWGLLPPTTDAPVAPAGHAVRVSPSRVEAALESPLNWFVQAAGGEAATDFARSLGTLVHAIAEDRPDATGDQYREELDRRWPELDLPENWETSRDRERAEAMLRKLAQYGLLMRQGGRRLVGREVDFDVEVTADGRTARLRGVIDRLEVDESGRPYVVDLKTGKSQPAAKDVDRNAQLGSYQAAVLAGALGDKLPSRPSGAALVQLGTATKSPREQAQPPVETEDWATPMVLEAAGLMGAADFLARHDPGKGRAGSCRLPGVCPLCTEGRQVTEP
ncbi:ATP-dependent helicase [Arthrobacter sp. KK5.5]|uniref:ATP-dependent helicase n=1 Tax=Arthrobacter sp. KK5.5 TaxID=3373084 RepID=UPI003EE7DF8F